MLDGAVDVSLLRELSEVMVNVISEQNEEIEHIYRMGY